MRFVGLPYIWGGDDPVVGMDCSGLVIELLQSQGILPRGYDSTAKGLHKDLMRRPGSSVIHPRFGVVLFFGKNLDTISHTGFCLTSELMLEAGGGDSTVTSSAAAAAKNAFVRIRPLIWRTDLVTWVYPEYRWEDKAWTLS